MTEKSRDALGGSVAILLGLAAFLVFAGWWVLLPQNISWLGERDRAMHTLGWFFYRDAAWTLPPGGSGPRLGIELSSSIALVDGLPIFAIPLKLFSAWLPRPFQYWGYWWLLCFVLQSLFAYLTARAMDAPRLIAVLAAGFAILTPAFLYRLPLHMALAGHWVIIAALWLYVRKSAPPLWAWPLLAGVTASIHAYLLAMVLAIWLAAYLQRLWLRALNTREILTEPVVVAVVLGLVLWSVGFLYPGTVTSSGFGFYRLNLLGPIITHHQWSQWVSSLPHSDYDYEGLSFLGIGIFAAIAMMILTGAAADLKHIFTRRWLPLILICILLCVFALSNVVGVFDREATPIPLFWPLDKLGATFRSSGRFVWPMLYLTTIAAVVLSARRIRLPVAASLLALFFAAQVYDSRAGWGEFRAFVSAPASTWPTMLHSPTWDRAVAAGYKRIRVIRDSIRNIGWLALEDFAYRNDLEIDAVYLGRINDVTRVALYHKEQADIVAGTLETGTIYTVDLANARRIAGHLASDDLLAVIDNRIVFARHGAPLVAGLGIDPQGARNAASWTPSYFPPGFY